MKQAKIARSRVVIPITPESDHESLLHFAELIAQSQHVILYGIVPLKEGDNPSEYTQAVRQLREKTQQAANQGSIHAHGRVKVSPNPWEDICKYIEKRPQINLLILDWAAQLNELGINADEILRSCPVDIGLLRGPIPKKLNKIYVPVRGGPSAEKALKVGLRLAKPNEAHVIATRFKRSIPRAGEEVSNEGLKELVSDLPNVDLESFTSDNFSQTIIDASKEFDLVLLGTSAFPTNEENSFGEITDEVLRDAKAGVLAIKSKREFHLYDNSNAVGNTAISELVDRWFAENTFHANEFQDLEALVRIKNQKGLTFSLALPALNEEKTIGEIFRIAKTLRDDVPLLDEIVLIDSNSTDRTREIAEEHGIPVYIHQEILPEHGSRIGKGEALWKSLYVTKGDIVLWVDTDITNFHQRFIYGLIGPLLTRPEVQLVKGFYRRPLRTGVGLQSGQGGRVTELTIRPLINLFYPQLSGIIQPLSGEYGGRREALEKVCFTSGYGVETSIMIDMFEQFKLRSIAQVNMIERIHTNQPLRALSKMSFGIMQTVISKLERRFGFSALSDVNRTMKLIKADGEDYNLEVVHIPENERPPMIEIPEYREKRGFTEEDSEKKVANL